MNLHAFSQAFKYAGLLSLFLIAAFTCGFGPPTLIDRDISPTYRLTVGQLRQIEGARAIPDEITGQAILVYDVAADRVLMEHNADQALPPASLTKLMTALLILEQDDLHAQITLAPADIIGGANMAAQAGERYTVEELLRGLLIPSANEAAMALARHHSGQVNVFVQRMNLRAQELGLQATHFENPEGFDSSGHVSSARDLLVLTQVLWQYPLFRELVGVPSTTIAGRTLQSTNQLLGNFPGANGVKTGTTIGAGQCLVASIVRNGRQLLIIILGSQDRYADARTLYSTYERNFGWRTATIPQRPTAFDRLYDNEGNRWFLAAVGDEPSMFLPDWELYRLRPYRRLYPLSEESWVSGSDVGVIEWRLGDAVVGTQRLVLR